MDFLMMVITAIFLILNFGLEAEGMRVTDESLLNTRKDNIQNKKARDIISSFLNAWKTSKIIPEYGRENSEKSRGSSQKFAGKHNDFQLDKLDFLGQRKSELDAPALFALRNALNPKPIRKPKMKQTNVEAETFVGHDDVDEDDRSPELKLASLVSKPIYHTLPAGARQNSEDDIKQFMFGGNNGVNDNNLGLPSDDWQASLNGRRSFVRIPGSERGYTYADDEGNQRYTENNGHKRNDIADNRALDEAVRTLRDGIPSDMEDQQEMRNVFRQVGDKKELITDPYDSLSLPVSEFISGQESDRKFYKTLPDNLLDEYETGQVPAQFKLQKNRLWGNIQKRWRRSKINRKQSWPLEEERQVKGVGRSLGGALGETGHTFDAYGEIGQGVDPSLMKLNGDRSGCGQSTDMNLAPLSMRSRENTPSMFLDTAGIQQDDSKQADSGIIQISPDGAHVRSAINRPTYETLRKRIMRNKRSALMLQKRTLQDALAKKLKAAKRKLLMAKAGSTAASRSISRHFMRGLPDSRGTENEDGIEEDNEHDNLEDKLSHDSTPLLMKIAQHDREDMSKLWNNKHSAGNGFYAGHGEGPNRAYLGDYFGHGPEEMLHDDGIKSLEESASPEDKHTASLIDSIWEHDLGEDHIGEHRVERHHGGLKIKNYFGGHHSPSIMLPTETLDGIDTHWTGHLPRVRTSEYSHNDGHPVDFPPTRIKAIQAIQDDPAIDAELNPHDGIGIAMSHGRHTSHGYHNGVGHAYGGMNLAPLVGDPVRVEDSHEEEYKQHIDNLLSQYHGLEEHLKGTDGTLAGHMDPNAFAHHGTHHLHTGYDLYAYKNPWENMKIPYHVPVNNHPMGDEEEAPPSPLTFEGKTDEKGAPMVEGGKEEGGKGGPLVEGSKALADKAGKGKESESPKGAKTSGSKSPMPVIPKQRGGPELSTGKNGTENDAGKEEAKETEENKQSVEEEKQKEEKNSAQGKASGKEKHQKENEEVKDSQEADKEKEESKLTESKDEKGKEEKGKEDQEKEDQEEAEKNLKKMVEKMMNSTGKQSEMLNTLKTALGDEAKNPKSVTSLQLAKLKQLGSMQQALLSSLAKQTTKKVKESGQADAEGAGLSDIKQLIELQSLQQLGAGLKANALVTAVRQNSLLQSLKSAQENILKNMKTHSGLLENNVLDKPEVTGNQASDIQKFFGKIPVRLLSSDLGNVGSEKVSSRSHQALGSSSNGEASNIGDLIHTLSTAHPKKPLPVSKASSIKPMLNQLLSESLLKTMKNKLKHASRSSLKETKDNSVSDKAYSTIGNEGPTTAADEESPHRRSPHSKDRKKGKTNGKKKQLAVEKEENETAVEKAEIAPFHEKDVEEDVVSKKDQIKPK